MPLPQTVRVKLSSEAAEAVTITPVVIQELPILELIEHMLGVAGKDEGRIREILLRGALVNGATRFRWAGLQADPESVREALAAFPDPDPALPFAAERCVRAVLRGGRSAIEVPRDAAGRSFFRRTAFWDVLMVTISAGAAYAGYSYRDRADKYARQFNAEEIARLRTASGGVRYTTLRDQIRTVTFTGAEAYVSRKLMAHGS